LPDGIIIFTPDDVSVESFLQEIRLTKINIAKNFINL